MTHWEDSCKSVTKERNEPGPFYEKIMMRERESGEDRWRITEIESGRLLTGREMKRQLLYGREPIKEDETAGL